MEHMGNLSALAGLFYLSKTVFQTDGDKLIHFYVLQLVSVKLSFM